MMLIQIIKDDKIQAAVVVEHGTAHLVSDDSGGRYGRDFEVVVQGGQPVLCVHNGDRGLAARCYTDVRVTYQDRRGVNALVETGVGTDCAEVN